MIDILIPTYNRADCLQKNILILNKLITESNLHKEFRIIVSNNHSTDNTEKVLEKIKDNINIPFITYQQNTNIGLEPNAVFLLNKSTSDYVMYVGDDDYIPEGYLNFIVEKIKKEKVHCIIPGFSGLLPDGKILPVREAVFSYKKYEAGFSTVCKISHYGHQLSGLLTKRIGLYEAYMERKENRNLYPFIYFVTHCMLRGPTYYAPQYQVLVSQGNTKDWRYDESGLLADVFKNYKIAFHKKPLKAAIASITFSKHQAWRLRIDENPIIAIKSFIHIATNKDVSLLIKTSLLCFYQYYYIKKALSLIKKYSKTGAAT